MDINCGGVIDGTETIEEVGSKGFQMMLDCASGTKVKERVARVRAERVCPLADGGHDLTPSDQGTKADGQAAEASGLGPSVQEARDGLPGPTCGRSSRQDLMVVVQELALAAGEALWRGQALRAMRVRITTIPVQRGFASAGRSQMSMARNRGRASCG